MRMGRSRGAVVLGVALGLVMGAAMAVGAQAATDEADRTATTYVTGTLGGPTGGTRGTTSEADGVVERRDWTFEGGAIETSDPRLNGAVTVTASGDERRTSDGLGVVILEAAHWHIDTGEGTWSGPGTAFETRGGGRATDLFTVLLTGRDAYEGLSVYLLIDQTVDPIAVEGTIFAGDFPPIPEAESPE